jgi:glutaredoxin
LLAEKKVDYECVEVDQISGDAQKNAVEEMKRLTGKTSFPVLVINNKVIQGFKPEEIAEALENEE